MQKMHEVMRAVLALRMGSARQKQNGPVGIADRADGLENRCDQDR